jgi:hypothetical protein
LRVEFRIGRKGFHGNSRFVGGLDEASAIEKQGATRIDGQGRGAATLHYFDGSQSHDGYIKTHILARLGNLYYN